MRFPQPLTAFDDVSGNAAPWNRSRRGTVSLYARADESSPPGAVFVAFCYYEAAINKLTNPVLDPFGKIPEFKYCAVRIRKGGTPPVQSSYGGGQILEALALVVS